MSVSENFINGFKNEGITVDVVNKTISFNRKSGIYIRKNSLLKPHLVYSDKDFGRVYSLFKRESLQDSSDAGVFVQALKNENGWKFKNKSHHRRITISGFVVL